MIETAAYTRAQKPVPNNCLSSLNDNSGLMTDIHTVGRIGDRLQDAVLKTPTQHNLSRENAFLNKLLVIAEDANLEKIATENVGASSCITYIPPAQKPSIDDLPAPPDHIMIANTGDCHAILFTISGERENTAVKTELLTRNRTNSADFFSGRNKPFNSSTEEYDKRAIQNRKSLHPTIEKYTLNRAGLQPGDKIFLGLFTDGAIPGIDTLAMPETDINNMEELKTIVKNIKKIENYARSIVKEWTALHGRDLSKGEQTNDNERLAVSFIKNARETGQKDCATALITDITDFQKVNGIVSGVFDGKRHNDSGKYSRTAAAYTCEAF